MWRYFFMGISSWNYGNEKSFPIYKKLNFTRKYLSSALSKISCKTHTHTPTDFLLLYYEDTTLQRRTISVQRLVRSFADQQTDIHPVLFMHKFECIDIQTKLPV